MKMSGSHLHPMASLPVIPSAGHLICLFAPIRCPTFPPAPANMCDDLYLFSAKGQAS